MISNDVPSVEIWSIVMAVYSITYCTLYACESSTVGKYNKHIHRAVEMKTSRRMLGISSSEKDRWVQNKIS